MADIRLIVLPEQSGRKKKGKTVVLEEYTGSDRYAYRLRQGKTTIKLTRGQAKALLSSVVGID